MSLRPSHSARCNTVPCVFMAALLTACSHSNVRAPASAYSPSTQPSRTAPVTPEHFIRAEPCSGLQISVRR
jgi:hypothetical protein